VKDLSPKDHFISDEETGFMEGFIALNPSAGDAGFLSERQIIRAMNRFDACNPNE